MNTTTPRTIGLMVTTESDNGYFHVRAYPVALDTESYGTIRNIRHETFYGSKGTRPDVSNGIYLPDLIVDSQGNNDDRSGRRLYGFSLSYAGPHRVELIHATLMAKSLTLLDKRMTKIYDVRGNARTIGEYIGRVAEVIGATVIVRASKHNSRSCTYDNGQYLRQTLGDGVLMIDGMVKEWVDAGAHAVAS